MSEAADFRPGCNIAVKVPSGRFDATVAFYRDTVGLTPVPSETGSQGFEFGDTRLWLDRVEHATHAEVWLELSTSDVDRGAAVLASGGARVADEIEPLDGRSAHWIVDPAGVVLLLSTHEGTQSRSRSS